MKKLLVAISALLLVLACEPINQEVIISVANIFVNPTAVTLVEGDTTTIVATVSPNNATNKDVIWTSDDASVVSVSNSGLISAKKPGQATVTAISDDGGHKAHCVITVEAMTHAVDSVSLNKSEIKLVEGDFETLIATVFPDNATNKRVTWTSTKPLVASVTSGLVEALSPGTAEIYVTTNDGGKQAYCTVTVEERIYHVEDVFLNVESVELTEGETYELIAEVVPQNAKNKNVAWSSTDENVASVENGKITAVGAGKATITVTTEENACTASCEVTVKAPVYLITEITLDIVEDSLVVGETLQLNATITPAYATNKNLEWNTTSGNIVTVSDTGLVTAVGPGDAYIYVIPEEGDCYAKTLFHVTSPSAPEEPEDPSEPEEPETPEEPSEPQDVPVTGIAFVNPSSQKTPDGKEFFKITLGESITLSVVVSPDDATNKKVIWLSSSPEVATVDANGEVTSVSSGITQIWATSEDNKECSEYCVVQVVSSTVTSE